MLRGVPKAKEHPTSLDTAHEIWAHGRSQKSIANIITGALPSCQACGLSWILRCRTVISRCQYDSIKFLPHAEALLFDRSLFKTHQARQGQARFSLCLNSWSVSLSIVHICFDRVHIRVLHGLEENVICRAQSPDTKARELTWFLREYVPLPDPDSSSEDDFDSEDYLYPEAGSACSFAQPGKS